MHHQGYQDDVYQTRLHSRITGASFRYHDASPRRSFPSQFLPFRLLGLPPIKTTEFFSFAQPPRHPSTGTLRQQPCTRLLTQMTGLEQITLNIAGAPSFIHTLEPVDGDLLCPKLRDLILIQANHGVDIRNSLTALSNQRMNHGCPLVWAA